MTIIRSTVLSFRTRQLRFIGYSMHALIRIFLLIPLKAYALCTLSNSDWLSRKSVPLPNRSTKEITSAMPLAGANAAGNSGIAESLHTADLSLTAGEV